MLKWITLESRVWENGVRLSQLIVACRECAVGKGAQLVKTPGHMMERKILILVHPCITMYSGPRTPLPVSLTAKRLFSVFL